MQKISILGTDYQVLLAPINDDYWGETDTKLKKILFTKDKHMKNETIAHELLHAYLYQCGLDNLCSDEVLHHSFGRFFEEFLKNYKIIQKILQTL